MLSLFFSGISTEKFDISPIRTFYRYYFLSFFILYYIYHAVKLSNFNFWHLKSIQLTLIDMI